MKLFLASSLDKTLPLLKSFIGRQDASEIKILFVPNAADPYKEKWWVDLDRNKFLELGYKVNEIDVRNMEEVEFSKVLAEVDILHICGGSVYYLIDLIRKQNIEHVIIDAVKSDRIVYTGTSAGSIIVSESIAAFSYDEEEKEYIAKVPSKEGLGLIHFGIVPHCNNSEFKEEHKKIIEHMSKDPTPLIFIQDSQAVALEGDSFKIVSVG